MNHLPQFLGLCLHNQLTHELSSNLKRNYLPLELLYDQLKTKKERIKSEK